MNTSDQIRKSLGECGEPMSMAQLADSNDWDDDQRKQAFKNLYNMKKVGEILTTIAEGKIHYQLAAGFVPKRKRGADQAVPPVKKTAAPKATPAPRAKAAPTRIVEAVAVAPVHMVSIPRASLRCLVRALVAALPGPCARRYASCTHGNRAA